MRVLGHRGWPAPAHPENTLASIVAALDAGADGVEVDIRLTADGAAYCCHDDDLARVGGQLASVRRATAARVATERLSGGHPVPPLAEVLALVSGRGTLVLDVKPDPRTGTVLRACLAALRLSGFPADDVVFSSFDPVMIDVLSVRSPRLARAVILDVGDPVEPALAQARRRGDGSVHLPLSSILADSAAVREAIAGGLVVRAWTVNRLVDAQLCELLGVEAVITDVPAVLAGRLATAS